MDYFCYATFFLRVRYKQEHFSLLLYQTLCLTPDIVNMYSWHTYKKVGYSWMILLLCLALYRCSSGEDQWKTNNRTTNEQNDLAIIPTSEQLGTLTARFETGDILVALRDGKSQPQAIYVYDHAGQLLYGENMPQFDEQSRLKIDARDMHKGDYLVRAIISENQSLEDWVYVGE